MRKVIAVVPIMILALYVTIVLPKNHAWFSAGDARSQRSILGVQEAVAGIDGKEIYKRFIAAAIPQAPEGPLGDPRVQEAMQKLLAQGETKQAAQLLAEAGWPKGFSIALSFSRFARDRADAEWLQTELKKINVHVYIID